MGGQEVVEDISYLIILTFYIKVSNQGSGKLEQSPKCRDKIQARVILTRKCWLLRRTILTLEQNLDFPFKDVRPEQCSLL